MTNGTQTAQPSKADERKRAYIKQLGGVMARYATSEELPDLEAALNDYKARVLAKRNAPGLNDASYALYAKYHLHSQSTSNPET
jgi:hypothetical protein